MPWSSARSISAKRASWFGCLRGNSASSGPWPRGARRLKNPFESALDVLTLCRIVFLHKSSEALDLVTEAYFCGGFAPRREPCRAYAGYYVAELLSDLTDDNDPHPELFDLADETLAAPAAGEVVHRRLGASTRPLRFLGHAPALERGRVRNEN